MYDITRGSKWCPTHIVLCFLFFSVLCTICFQFLWMVHFWLPLRYSLTFIYYLLNLQKTCYNNIYIFISNIYFLFISHKFRLLLSCKKRPCLFFLQLSDEIVSKSGFLCVRDKVKNYMHTTFVLTGQISDYIPLIIYFLVNLLQCIQIY